MPRYTQDSRERVRDAVDFEELVGARTELRRAGVRRLQGLCPFHEERTPSFGIDPVEKLYHCFGCGAGGDVFQFVIETEGLDFTGALESLGDRSGGCSSARPRTTCACCGRARRRPMRAST
jgi:DNA primase